MQKEKISTGHKIKLGAFRCDSRSRARPTDKTSRGARASLMVRIRGFAILTDREREQTSPVLMPRAVNRSSAAITRAEIKVVQHVLNRGLNIIVSI